MLNPYFILQSITTELKVQKQCARGVMYNVLFFTIFQKAQESTCAGALIFTQLFRSLSEKKKKGFFRNVGSWSLKCTVLMFFATLHYVIPHSLNCWKV